MRKFKDIEGHYGKDHIEKLEAYGVINGDGEGNFKPNENMTRADFAIMLANALTVLGK